MKKFLIIVIIAIFAIQFITIDKTNPSVDLEKDFIHYSDPPVNIRELLKSSCYDCHSNETRYPWYSNIAPISWLIKEHVNNGRRHLNFSVWTEYKEAKKDQKIDECIEMIKSKEMPLKGYLLFHSKADLNAIQRLEMINWLNSKLGK